MGGIKREDGATLGELTVLMFGGVQFGSKRDTYVPHVKAEYIQISSSTNSYDGIVGNIIGRCPGRSGSSGKRVQEYTHVIHQGLVAVFTLFNYWSPRTVPNMNLARPLKNPCSLRIETHKMAMILPQRDTGTCQWRRTILM